MRLIHTLILLLYAPMIFALHPIEIRNAKLYANNKELKLKGLNWFGFNNDQTFFDGLWIGGTAIATDFSMINTKIKLLGFNAIRVPFRYKDLVAKPLTKKIVCQSSTWEDLIRNVKMSDERGKNKRPTGKWHGERYGICNLDIPDQSTLQRFHWAIQEFIKKDMYVVIDYHAMGSENEDKDRDLFVRRWVDLWKSIMRLPNFNTQLRGRIIIDIMNEPDSMHFGWENLEMFYLQTMDAIWKIDNQAIFMIEGTGQTGYQLCWGNGFVTKKEVINQYRLSDPTRFFYNLRKKPYKQRVIISPHLYGPTISKDNVYYKGPELWKRLNDSFGYLHKEFPIVIGEFGSFFKDPRDITYYNDFAWWYNKYLQSASGWMYWCYNANSGDTGGIVANNWLDIEWLKINWLRKHLNL